MSLAQTRSVTYLQNSDHELNIYFINGKEQGATMMVIGGIQGDEPGGYLAADLYADLALEKGNLIIAPRANFISIKQNTRGVNGDMNRKFTYNNEETVDYDRYIVEILKSLILKSDVLLNLHEGSGFYNPDYISDMENPLRFGQSIIADAAEYTTRDGESLHLEATARQVIEKVNQNIKEPKHIFRFNNHNTLSDLSLHKEQRKSATFFALTEANIPAFGVETSKSISDVATKVKYETLVINAFMAEYGIIPENPSISLPVPELEHLVIQVIGSPNPFAVRNGDTLTVPTGASIQISSVVANYKRGISVDIEGIGNTNDLGRVAVIDASTAILVLKDAYVCGKVMVETTKERVPAAVLSVTVIPMSRLKQIELSFGDKNFIVSEGDTIHIVRGDILKIVDARTVHDLHDGFRINFVGFDNTIQGNKRYNDAEDRRYLVNTASDLQKRFSLDGRGFLYQIKAETLEVKKDIGAVYVFIEEPEVKYLIVERADGTRLALSPDSVVNCTRGEPVKVLALISNVACQPQVETFIVQNGERPAAVELPVTLEITSDVNISFQRSLVRLGAVHFKISL